MKPAVPLLIVATPSNEDTSQMNNIEEFNFNISPSDQKY